MRRLLPIGLLLIISCNTAEKKVTVNMPGAYKMVSQSAKNATLDSTITTGQQLKIFTDDFVMYANVNPADSVSAFGIGSYTVKMDTVTENMIYRSSDTSTVDTPSSYTLLIKMTDNGFQQVIPDMMINDQKTIWTESYDAVGKAVKTPLDGAWKQTSSYFVKGTDTIPNIVSQYKIYFNGYCIWGNSYKDASNVKHTGVAFGTFEMKGDNKFRESMTASTFSLVRGHDFDIDLELNGTDEFKQIITEVNGGKTVELYQRLKK